MSGERFAVPAHHSQLAARNSKLATRSSLLVSIDLNSDLGESFGAWTLGRDAEVLPHITSANIACGFHAGDPSVMRRTILAALEHRVAIGAHPGLPDLAGFGRRTMQVTPDEVYDMVVYQVGALAGVAKSVGGQVAHVKPHGALYNMAAGDASLADAIARAVRDVDPALALFGLAGSALVDAGRAHRLRTVPEGFPDRGYDAHGRLLPRSHADALVTDPAAIAARALAMAQAGSAETLCIHGDGPQAPQAARAVRDALAAAGITVAAPGSAT